jgi:hypothetical protein
MKARDAVGRQLPLVSSPQTQTTGNDFYTPPALFLALGLTFDLDVCAPPGGVPWIPATRHFTLEDDGLGQEWIGRVWMNPPFSKPAPWVERFIAHRNGVALLPQAKSRWYGLLWDSDAALICIPETFGFIRPGPGVNDIASPLVLAAFTDECVAAISKLGRVRNVA